VFPSGKRPTAIIARRVQRVETKMLTHPNATCVGCSVVFSASPESRAVSCPAIKVINVRLAVRLAARNLYLFPLRLNSLHPRDDSCLHAAQRNSQNNSLFSTTDHGLSLSLITAESLEETRIRTRIRRYAPARCDR